MLTHPAAPALARAQPPEGLIMVRAVLNRPGYSCAAPDGARGMELSFAKDTRGLFPEGLRVRWMGPAAAAFLDAHQDELRPGRALDMALYHVRARDGEVRAYTTGCQFAPLAPSWIRHAEKTCSERTAHHES